MPQSFPTSCPSSLTWLSDADLLSWPSCDLQFRFHPCQHVCFEASNLCDEQAPPQGVCDRILTLGACLHHSNNNMAGLCCGLVCIYLLTKTVHHTVHREVQCWSTTSMVGRQLLTNQQFWCASCARVPVVNRQCNSRCCSRFMNDMRNDNALAVHYSHFPTCLMLKHICNSSLCILVQLYFLG